MCHFSYEEGPYFVAGSQRFPSTGLLSPWKMRLNDLSIFQSIYQMPGTAKWTERIADERILEKRLGGNRGPARENA